MKRRTAVLVPSVLLSLGALALTTPAIGSTGHPPAGASEPAASARHHESVVEAIDRGAHTLRTTRPTGSLRDLDALGRMVGDAEVVGLGEATHGSREFFRMKHRVFRYLVEEKGFRTFSLELPWSSGVRLNEYVVEGKGDLDEIAGEEFLGTYRAWNNQDYRDLLTWMRNHNRRHPEDPVRFMGNDMGYAGPELYERVVDHVARAHPELLDEVTELYRGLPPTTDAGTYGEEYLALPLDERRERAERTGQVHALLRAAEPGDGEHAWTTRHALAIHQMAEGMSFDFDDEAQLVEMMEYRDEVMADNVRWWHRQTGDRTLLSAHNTHVSYDSFDANYPKTQGAFLRDALGDGYLSIGFSFHEGAFKAFGTDDDVIRTYRVGAAEPGSNEAILDRTRREDYFLDMRTAPEPARAWLDVERPAWIIGAGWPDPTEYTTALGRAHDILIHLHDVEATTYLGDS
ncbi:erythromycin esterase family protein [Streptomyces sedi]|uniref:Erythromycin esterase family protein n=1 Tax=Streptomyces sedi TaxID=555059 RepID=A0A5C4VAW7_9ACTN|nr:erythromycin esterase family protein [Streptomyces sedi]TNM32715.1 erythromycin esterase family protein [Streptomyces sedi]